MFICGNNFVGGSMACSLTPTGIRNINYVELKNGIYDDLYITKATDFEIKYDDESIFVWDFDTILWAQFNNTTNAGNVDWSVNDVSHLLLKSRKIGTYKWKTLVVKNITDVRDFFINYNDYFVGSGEEIEYAFVPSFYGAEGLYTTAKEKLNFEDIFIIEDEIVWHTPITDAICNTTRNIPSANVELLNGKYPVFVRNTKANYDTGTIEGAFLPTRDDECTILDINQDTDYRRIIFQKEAMDFIADSIPKILKLPDGRKWLVQVTPNPTDTARDTYNNSYISFSWVEIGDMDSEEDLYYLGLSDISPEWWNNY